MTISFKQNYTNKPDIGLIVGDVFVIFLEWTNLREPVKGKFLGIISVRLSVLNLLSNRIDDCSVYSIAVTQQAHSRFQSQTKKLSEKSCSLLQCP